MMKIKRKKLAVGTFIFFIPFIMAYGISAEVSKRPDFIIAYATKILADVDAKDAAAAMRIYVDELSRGQGYRGEAYAYESIDDVLDKLQKGTVDFLSLSALEYLHIKNKVDISLSLGHVKGGKGSYRYLLLTKANLGYTKLADLKGKSIALMRGDDIAALYLETLLLKNGHGDMEFFFSSVQEKTKPSQVMLSAFFGQTEACLTTDVALATMVEMNPQLGSALKVMNSSQELMTIVTAFRRGVDPVMQQKLMKFAQNLQHNPRGKQVLMLFKIDRLIPIKESDLAGLKELLSENERLRFGKR